MKNKIISIIKTILLVAFPVLVLLLSLHGIKGNPTESTLNNPIWKDEGPLELSPDRGRFALMYSIVESNSFQFSLPIARFAAPDVAFYNGQYVSLFAPAVSFLVAPGYLIGKAFGASQVGAFAVIALFGLMNMFLIRAIVSSLTKNKLAGTLAGFIFLFATPAFPYAVTLYQHHVTTFLVLFSIYILTKSDSLLVIGSVLFMCALSIPVDNPNAIFMFPIGLYAVLKLFKLETLTEKIKIRVRYFGVLSILLAVIPMLLMFAFDQISHGQPFKLSGTLQAVKIIGDNGKPVISPQSQKDDPKTTLQAETKQKTATGFFKTRNMLNGFYIHLVSPDRGTLIFAPIIFFGFLGLVRFPKKYTAIGVVTFAVAGSIFVLYSMWGDPWGGWAFGSRYMIPAYAAMSIFLGVALVRIAKNYLLSFLFALVVLYSLSVNALGAVTTNRNPPQVEAVALQETSRRIENYSYDRNWEFLMSNRSKSFVFQNYLSTSMNAQDFYFLVVAINIVVFLPLFTYFVYTTRKSKK